MTSSTPYKVIAFVPGTTASILSDSDGEEVWPRLLDPSLSDVEKLLLANKVKSATPLSVDGIVLDYPNPAQASSTLPCYQSLVTYFEATLKLQSFAYTTSVDQNSTNTLVPTGNLFFQVPYDWRQSNWSSAAWLNRALNYLDAAFNALNPNPGYELYLVAHSMGGLVSRYLLENSTVLPSTNANYVKPGAWLTNAQSVTLITLSTPHLGAPLALAPMLGLDLLPNEKNSVIDFLQGVVNDTNTPSTYQLLPPPASSGVSGLDFVFDGSGNAYDLYTNYTAQPGKNFMKTLGSMGLNSTNLTTAQTFFSGLSYTAPGGSVTYHCFGGTGLPTRANPSPQSSPASGPYLFTPAKHPDLFAGAITEQPQTGDGDGVVPTSSSQFVFSNSSPYWRAFPNYNHGQMGGSDMTDHPDAINAMLSVVGITATNPAPVPA
ncbi:MAG TPA: hypothetical protein VD995_03560 [Azospirillum sp.]|nr:hypothetical protein [Azospirillum sp.]